MQVAAYTVRTDIVVVDTNPEMADYDNPHGHVYGFAAFVQAESARGDRRQLHVVTLRVESLAADAAQRIADALTARLAAGKLPVAFDRWTDARPAYGSDAYLDYGQDDDVALERREAEEEAWG
jgi:hypothetical protein